VPRPRAVLRRRRWPNPDACAADLLSPPAYLFVCSNPIPEPFRLLVRMVSRLGFHDSQFWWFLCNVSTTFSPPCVVELFTPPPPSGWSRIVLPFPRKNTPHALLSSSSGRTGHDPSQYRREEHPLLLAGRNVHQCRMQASLRAATNPARPLLPLAWTARRLGASTHSSHSVTGPASERLRSRPHRSSAATARPGAYRTNHPHQLTEPPIRRLSSLVYDPAIKKIVLFGGFDETNFLDQPGSGRH